MADACNYTCPHNNKFPRIRSLGCRHSHDGIHLPPNNLAGIVGDGVKDGNKSRADDRAPANVRPPANDSALPSVASLLATVSTNPGTMPSTEVAGTLGDDVDGGNKSSVDEGAPAHNSPPPSVAPVAAATVPHLPLVTAPPPLFGETSPTEVSQKRSFAITRGSSDNSSLAESTSAAMNKSEGSNPIIQNEGRKATRIGDTSWKDLLKLKMPKANTMRPIETPMPQHGNKISQRGKKVDLGKRLEMARRRDLGLRRTNRAEANLLSPAVKDSIEVIHGKEVNNSNSFPLTVIHLLSQPLFSFIGICEFVLFQL